VSGYASGERTIADEETQFDIPIKGSLHEVSGGDEHRLLVGHDRLGIEHGAGSIEVDRALCKSRPIPLSAQRGEGQGEGRVLFR